MSAASIPALSEPLLAALDRPGTVLVPTRRAAQALRHAFNQRMQTAGHTRWTPPEIATLDAWLEQMHRRLVLNGHEGRLLLNPAQEHAVWRAIIAADTATATLRPPDALAELAAEAWSLLCLHNGRERLREAGVTSDGRAFQRWAQAFERRCQRDQLLPAAQLPHALADALADATLDLPQSLTLVDFAPLPPEIADLFEAIRRSGHSADDLRTEVPATPSLHIASDDTAELEAAASWSKTLLDHNPAARIAIVVTDQADRRSAIERIFGNLLAPELEPITAVAMPAPFEFSLGVPLPDTAVAAAALDLLRWTLEPLPLASVGALLLSPFFGAAHLEGPAAAAFDARLRRRTRLRPELALDGAIDLVAEERALPNLLYRLRALRSAIAHETQQQTYAEWTDHFREALEAAGWTRAANAGPLSYQARERWDNVLDQAATLDFDNSRPTAAQALAAVTRLARQTIFAPASTHAPVQILGPLELGAVAFDALWFLGADDQHWPAPASPNPLLPFALQKHLGLPGSDAIRDSTRVRLLTERIARTASQVVFSYAAKDAEGDRRPSPLLTNLALHALHPAPATATTTRHDYTGHVDDLSIPPPPEGVSQGGAEILRDQAACPFRAFALHRLRAEEPDEPSLGLNAGDRGSLVHRVMEHLWNEIGAQQVLAGLSSDDLSELLTWSIDQALGRTRQLATSDWDDAYVAVERTRLHALLRPWLEVELSRPEFKVRARETEWTAVPVGPLTLTVRPDRIDDTLAGALILDYKTGPTSTTDWLSTRPESPQLPLYAMLEAARSEESKPVAGIAFASLRAGNDLKLEGFASGPDVLANPKNKLSFDEQMNQWTGILHTLAQDFHDGRAQVDPACYPGTCKHCSQRIACRLDVTALDDLGDDDEPTGRPRPYGDGDA